MVALLKKIGTSVLFVTHDPEEALYVADQVAVMGGGVIQQVAAPDDLYFAPANRFVAAFFGDANVIPATVKSGLAETPLGSVATSLPDGPADVIVRATGLVVSSGTTAHAIVRSARILGATMMVELEPLPVTGLRGPLIARMQLGPRPQVGANVTLALNPRLTFAFPREG
jgi:ABC-type Fe3+/spermidine/putrescine transport system ATPase subunit